MKARAPIAGVVLLVLGAFSSSRADTSIRPPAQPTGTQAMAAARRLWKAVRARDEKGIAAAVDQRVHMWASLAGLAVDDNYEADVERAGFARRMTTLELGDKPATNWRVLAKPPLAMSGDVMWVGAEVQATTGSEGHGARTGDLAFGVRVRDGRALVVGFDVTYAESRLIFSR